MSQQATVDYQNFKLPSGLITRSDIARFVGELEQTDNDLTTAAVRQKIGKTGNPAPTVSDLVTDFLNLNDLSLENSSQRTAIIHELRKLKDAAPIVHLTFAVVADRTSLQEIIVWLRQSIHPQAVMTVGLQPALVAGVYMRTPNKVHDLSMRAVLKGKRDVLRRQLRDLSKISEAN